MDVITVDLVLPIGDDWATTSWVSLSETHSQVFHETCPKTVTAITIRWGSWGHAERMVIRQMETEPAERSLQLAFQVRHFLSR